MRTAVKNKVKIVSAFRLGENTETERQLIETGLIRVHDDDTFELFSIETVNGKGEIARRGDFFKLSTTGEPYPNSAEFFLRNHRLLDDGQYAQIPKPLEIWTAEDEICPEIIFLQQYKGLVIDPDSLENRYSAPLWGTILYAAADAVIVFYSIEKDQDGTITDADFNFVSRDEFDKTYTICSE